jgi:hypothetical protein
LDEKVLNLAITSWTQQGIRLQPPASEDEIRSTFENCGQPATLDVVNVYRHLNGFCDSEYCRNLWSLWSLAKIRDANQFNTSQHVWFADFLIDSCYFSLQTESSQTSSVHVQYYNSTVGFETFKVADSLAEFWQRLITDPATVHVFPA